MTTPPQPESTPESTPDLGAFSISLAVADLAASRAFYQALGFEVSGGDETSWLILVRGEAVIGLFQGMFERNILTFNPSDARGLQAAAEAAGLEPLERAAAGDAPTHFTLVDPDGNPLLFDQHDAGPGSAWRGYEAAHLRSVIAHLEARLARLEGD